VETALKILDLWSVYTKLVLQHFLVRGKPKGRRMEGRMIPTFSHVDFPLYVSVILQTNSKNSLGVVALKSLKTTFIVIQNIFKYVSEQA